MKIELELPEIPGYEYTGEYRPPKAGEWFCAGDGTATRAWHNFTSCHPILRKVEPSKPKYRPYKGAELAWLVGQRVVRKGGGNVYVVTCYSPVNDRVCLHWWMDSTHLFDNYELVTDIQPDGTMTTAILGVLE